MKNKKVKLLLSSKIVLGLILATLVISSLVPYIIEKISYDNELMGIKDKSACVFWQLILLLCWQRESL